VSERRRFAVLGRLGLTPTVSDVVRDRLDEAFARAEARKAGAAGAAGAGADDAEGSAGPPAIDALDAGCGRISALARYRPRIRELVGADLHEPPPGALPHLDRFVAVDLCGEADAFPAGGFDVVLSSFTAEHFADPPAAFRNIAAWLAPGGTVVLTTVNRRHPFVALYLGMGDAIRRPLQRLVKETAADAHPLVGVCNDPATIRRALEAAGFTDIRIATVPHLARAWGRLLPAWLLGLIGDLAAQPFPGRRSTIIADARVPG
jgi:SAM-dependent methyltransferase